jgi:hypothetical protein
VGSCTDLRAAVSYPLRRLYGDQFHIAPLTALVDPIRALRVLGIEPGKNFSPKVNYIYRKQLEEADLILINKCELLELERAQRLEDALRAEFPKASVMRVSARESTGLDAWFERLGADDMGSDAAPEVDYEVYAEGEALLGWYNSTVRLEAGDEFDGNEFLKNLAAEIHRVLGDQAVEVAHLKMTLVPGEEGGDIGVINLVRTGGGAELSHSLREPMTSGELTINLRAEGDPEVLSKVVGDALKKSESPVAVVEHEESFRPGKPSPTYRMALA